MQHWRGFIIPPIRRGSAETKKSLFTHLLYNTSMPETISKRVDRLLVGIRNPWESSQVPSQLTHIVLKHVAAEQHREEG